VIGPSWTCFVNALGFPSCLWATIRLRSRSSLWCANDARWVDGFNAHANTAFAANDRDGPDRPLRYIARPPFSEERLSQLDDGRAAVRLKTPWRDGTTHVAFTPIAGGGKAAP